MVDWKLKADECKARRTNLVVLIQWYSNKPQGIYFLLIQIMQQEKENKSPGTGLDSTAAQFILQLRTGIHNVCAHSYIYIKIGEDMHYLLELNR